MTLPLSGLLVVSLEQAVAAPMCTCRLADAGARVLKIERPEGDFARYYDQFAHGECSYFVWLNRGKESVVLDLARADDKALLEALLKRADIFVLASKTADDGDRVMIVVGLIKGHGGCKRQGRQWSMVVALCKTIEGAMDRALRH